MQILRNTLLVLASICGSIFSISTPMFLTSSGLGKLTTKTVQLTFWLSGGSLLFCVVVLYVIAKKTVRSEDMLYLRSFMQGMMNTFVLIFIVVYWFISSIGNL